METQTYDLLSVGAHPDDVEVGTGGVLIGLNESGYRCGVVILTQGEMGTGGTAEIRSKELHAAARVLQADIVKVFDWGDTKLEDSYDKRLALAQVIRDTRPQIVLAPYPHVGHGRRQSHPDHVASGVIAINAANLAALRKAELTGEPHLVSRIFHYFLPPGVTPNFVVNITPQFERWLDALRAHESQFLNPDKSRDYIESIAAYARSFGQQSGCKYGHGFYAVEPILVDDIMTLVEPRPHTAGTHLV